VYLVVAAGSLSACGSGVAETDALETSTTVAAPPTTSYEALLEKRLARLKSVIAGQIPVPIPQWNCDPEDQKFKQAGPVTQFSALTGDCLWSSDSSILELDLFCGQAAERSCDVKLRSLMESTGAFNSLDLAKMMATRVLDGLQTSQDGFVTWSISGRGIRLIIDAAGLVESGRFT
jgi:hypothetical protein